MGVSISISITQNSQRVSNKTSNVTVKVNASWTYGSYNQLQKPGWLKIDGTTYNFTSSFNYDKTTSGSQNLFTKTVTIRHNNDGTKTLPCSASFTTGVSSGTVTASASKTLTTIPLKSTLTASNGTLGTKQTLTVTRHSNSFTHTVSYKCGSVAGAICSRSTDTTLDWTPPMSLASQNTTGTSVLVTFTINTYDGTTLAGASTKQITCSIPASVKPSCSLAITDPTGISAKYGSFVRGLSKFKVVVTPTISHGSAIASYKSTANGAIYTASSFTTGVLSSSGSLTISSTVTDRRGRSGSASVKETVLNYSAPVISKLNVKRCDELGNDNDRGENVRVQFNASVSDLNNLNTSLYVLKYKKTSEAVYTEVEFDDLTNVFVVNNGEFIFPADGGSSYDIELSIKDNHNTTARATTASTGFTLMHWNATGDAMGIGKISELPGVLDIGLQTRFYGGILHPVLEPNTDLNEVRTPNTYVGADVSDYNYANCPLTTGTFTLEVVGMGEDGQVKQRITYCHKTAARALERIYYASTWGAWVCVSDFNGQLLANPDWYMTAGHIVTLAEPISHQRNGIVLVFSEYYDAEPKNQTFASFFVPKMAVSMHNGAGHTFSMQTGNMAFHATKYLYINDTTITGHDNNNKTGTSDCGITYTNNRFVLRYVIGV